MDLAARHAQVLTDQIRHGFATRAPFDVPAAARGGQSWANARRSGLRGVEGPALAQLARQDRIRLRALCAGLRALRGPIVRCVACDEGVIEVGTCRHCDSPIYETCPECGG